MCDHLLCITCKVVDHDCHKTETIATALERVIPTMQAQINSVSGCVQTAEKQIELLKQHKQSLAESFNQVKVNMEAQKDDLIRKILNDHTALLKLVDSEQERKLSELDANLSGIEDRINERRHLITWANTSLQAAQGASLLYEIQSGLGNKLRDMATDEIALPPAQTHYEPPVTFQPRTEATVESDNFIGQLVFSKMQDTTSEVATKTMPNDNTDLPSNRTWPFSLDRLKTSDVVKASQIDIPEGHLCYRFGIVNDSIWLPMYNKNCILIYALDGQQQRIIRFQKLIKRPKAVLAQSKQHVVVCSQSGLFVIDESDGSIEQNVCSGQFSDISMTEHCLMALEWKRGKIHLFTQNNNAWEPVRQCDVTYSDRHIGDTFLLSTNQASDNEDTFLVCSWQKHVLYEYTDNDDVIKQQLGGPGQAEIGQLYCPGVCGRDKDGAVLVADCGNHRLQLLQPGEEWHVLKLDGLQCPWDVWFQDENTLWVLNNEKVLIQYVIDNKHGED